MPPWLRWALFLTVTGGLAASWITRPDRLDAAVIEGLAGDAAAGEQVFLATGCASCHIAPGEQPEGPPVLAGGQELKTKFGTFVAPNISPDAEHGVGGWSDADLLNAIARGVSPNGAHYYPAFPYNAYNKADPGDLVDLVAYLRTLPASAAPSRPHKLSFPFTIRRGIGLWKLFFVSDDWVLTGDLEPTLSRGRMLVEGLAHCGECHTPRNLAGGLIRSRWLGGAADPTGTGRIPAIDPAHLDWSDGDIAAFLNTGLTPDYDSAGGHMVAVIDKLSQLPVSDREAIVDYLDAIPPVRE